MPDRLVMAEHTIASLRLSGDEPFAELPQILGMRPVALLLWQQDALLLALKHRPPFRRHIVVRDPQLMLFGKHDQMPGEHPVHHARERDAIADDVGTAFANWPVMDSMHFGPATVIDVPNNYPDRLQQARGWEPHVHEAQRSVSSPSMEEERIKCSA
jgi:hypothetical protein